MVAGDLSPEDGDQVVGAGLTELGGDPNQEGPDQPDDDRPGDVRLDGNSIHVGLDHTGDIERNVAITG